MSEPRRRRFVSGTDVSRCDEECLRTGFCTDFCKVGQDFLAVRQPTTEPASGAFPEGNDGEPGAAVPVPASEPAGDFELWSRVDVGPGAYQWMVWCVGAMDATWFRTEADARAALAAARGDTP